MDHTDNVSTKTIKKIVKNCSPEDFISVLKEYGDAPTVDRSGRKIGNDIDIIASCLSSVFCKARNKKRALLAAYIGKSGVFAKDQPVPESAVSALQKKVAELTATADELTARAGKSDALTARVTELEENEKNLLGIIETLLHAAAPAKDETSPQENGKTSASTPPSPPAP